MYGPESINIKLLLFRNVRRVGVSSIPSRIVPFTDDTDTNSPDCYKKRLQADTKPDQGKGEVEGEAEDEQESRRRTMWRIGLRPTTFASHEGIARTTMIVGRIEEGPDGDGTTIRRTEA